MYHAITGDPPFDAANPVKVVLQHIKEEPKPLHQSDLEPDKTMQALESCILRCLEKDPIDRFQSADELLAHLHSLEYKHKIRDVQAEAQVAPWRRLMAHAVDALVLTFIVQGTGYVLFGAQNIFSAEGMQHTAQWQLALLGAFCTTLRPFLDLLTKLLCYSFISLPAPFIFIFLFSQTIPFFGSIGGGILLPIAPFFYAIYCIALESSPLKGTLGQRLFGLEVVSETGQRLNILQASKRMACKFIWPIIMLGTVATTPWRKISRGKRTQSGPRIWQFFKYFPVDGFSRTYVIKKKQTGAYSIHRENYVPCDSSISESKLLLLQKRWLQNLPLHLFVSLPIIGMVYIMTPANFAWLGPLFLFLTIMPFALIQYRLMHSRNAKPKNATHEMISKNG
jgi:uncharacterized RDD family membrane protein YckC